MSIELEELLARATALEEKAAALMAGQAAPVVETGADAELVAALQAKIAQLEDTVDVLSASSPAGVDPVADFEAGDEPAAPAAPAADESWLAVLAEGGFGDDDPDEPVTDPAQAADLADLAALADQLDAEADADDAEAKGFDFDDLDAYDFVDLEGKAGTDPFTRDTIGRFATTSGGGKAKDDPKDKPDEKIESMDDVRRLLHDWQSIPAADKAGLKAKMEAFVKAHSDGSHEHTRLAALVGGIGDGDGKAEAGEGAAAAVASGHAEQWLEQQGIIHPAPAKPAAGSSSSHHAAATSSGGSGSGHAGGAAAGTGVRMGGGSNEGGHPLPTDPEQYRVNNPDDVRAVASSWPHVPAAARRRLKERLLHALGHDAKHGRLRALVNGLGDGDGKAEAGEGAGHAMATGHAAEWLAKHGKKDADLDLESKDGFVTMDEMELLQARRAQLGV